jgi:hypothetical protein
MTDRAQNDPTLQQFSNIGSFCLSRPRGAKFTVRYGVYFKSQFLRYRANFYIYGANFCYVLSQFLYSIFLLAAYAVK